MRRSGGTLYSGVGEHCTAEWGNIVQRSGGALYSVVGGVSCGRVGEVTGVPIAL